MAVVPVSLKVVNSHKYLENFPSVGDEGVMIVSVGLRRRGSQRVVLHPHVERVRIKSDVNFFLLSPANISVARHPDFLADYNIMGPIRGQLTSHFEYKTLPGLSHWDMNLDYNINIQPWQKTKLFSTRIVISHDVLVPTSGAGAM